MNEQQNVNMGQTPSSNTTQGKSATWNEQQDFQPSAISIGQEVEYVGEGMTAQEGTIAELCDKTTGRVNLRMKGGDQIVNDVRYSQTPVARTWHFKGQSGSRPRSNTT